MGESDEAIGMLERAIALKPDFLDAWAYKAMALARIGRTAEAIQVIHDAEQRFPESRGSLEALLGGIRGEPSPRTVTRTDVAGDRVSGVIALDPSAASHVRYPAVVFVYLRPEQVTVGPPSAVLRLEVNAFPVAFSLGPENAMIGGRLPRTVRVEARIDPDGNATTREPDARHGSIDRVALGSSSLQILVR
jgi:tetratricopeptide (TPR) repeat protein